VERPARRIRFQDWKNRRVAIDFEAEGLLKGTRGKARQARRELLEELAADGVPLEELRLAVEEDRLALVPVERVLEAEGPRYTAAEIAERSGVDEDFLRRQLRALGLPTPEPGEAVFTDEDLEAARRVKAFRDSDLPDDGLLEVSRVIGTAMSQVAAATRSLIRDALLRPGDTERDLGLRFARAAEVFNPMVGPMLEYVYRIHQRELVRNDAVGFAELRAGRLPGSQEITACFADLVGFTKLGEELAPEELGAVTGRLDELAREVTDPPVRLVKMIGDAAMLVSPDNDALLDASLSLVESAEADEDFPLIRAGAARGAALSRGGDWYGRPVNMASRITAVAYPASVLVSEEVHETATNGYRWSFAGARRLKGFDRAVKLFRVRREEG
jgi:adenylate cyclase